MKRTKDHVFVAADGRMFRDNDMLAYGDYHGSTVQCANVGWVEKHYGKYGESPIERRCGDPDFLYGENEYEEPDNQTMYLELRQGYGSVSLYILDFDSLPTGSYNDEWLEKAKGLFESVNALSDDPLIDDESLFRLESELTEGYLADGILSAWRSPSRLPFLSEEEAISWENLPSGKQKEFVETMLDLFPRYHEPSGENVVIFETGCVPYCRHFDVLLEKAYEAMIEQDCQKWREAGKERGLAFAKHNTTREEAYEAEENDRQYSPFEFTACELNRLPWSDEAWTAYDEGIAEGISSLPEETTDDR